MAEGGKANPASGSPSSKAPAIPRAASAPATPAGAASSEPPSTPPASAAPRSAPPVRAPGSLPPPPPSASVDPLLGRVVNGRYKIVSLLARGGMGRVYRAEQSPLGRVCALKVLSTNYEGEHDPEFHKRFFLEASIAVEDHAPQHA